MTEETMTQDRFEDYRVDHLILLVGGNPLPNAIAGKLLVKPEGRITLVHSRDTTGVAKRLEEFLAHRATVVLVQVDESDPRSIHAVVGSLLSSTRIAEKIGLNYTGGTKAMAVHAVRAGIAWAQLPERPREIEFSYVDGRDDRIIIDRKAEGGEDVYGLPISNAFTITLHNLIKLHGWEPGGRELRRSIMPTTAMVLLDLYTDPEFVQQWEEWKMRTLDTDNFRKQVNPKRPWRRPNWLGEGQLKDKVIGIQDARIRRSIEAELNLGSDHLTIGAIRKAVNLKDSEDICKWLDGTWLESAVFESLHNQYDRLQLSDLVTGVRPKIGYDGGGGGKVTVDFELDVVAIRGYQVFVLSCTSEQSDLSLIKHKLLEAAIRARQLGGDRARFALVCAANPVDRRTTELQLRSELEDGSIRVFGSEHFADIATHLQSWISG